MASVQTSPDTTDLSGLYQALMQGVDPSELPPVPEGGDYGAPAVTRDVGPQSLALPPAAPNPLAVALSGSSPDFAGMLSSALSGGAPSTGSRYDQATGDFLPPGSTAAPPAAPMQAALHTAASPVASSDDSDTTPGHAADTTMAQYKAAHDTALANRAQFEAMARQTAGTPASAIYLKMAEESLNTAEKINLLGIEYSKPAAPSYEHITLPNGQIVSFDKTTGEYGKPYGQPTPSPQAPPPVTDAQREFYGLPKTGAFTIAPGEAPKAITGAGTNTEPRLPPNAIDDLAQRYLAGDNTAVTVLGYASATDKAAVITRAAELRQQQGGAATDQLNNRIALGGRMQEARTSGALGAKIDQFGESTMGALDNVQKNSDNVPRGNWMPLNQIQQMGEKIASNPPLAAFNSSIETAVNEYARATTMTGQQTDTAKAHAYNMLNQAQSPEAMRAVLDNLRFEIRNLQNVSRVHRGLDALPNNFGAQGTPAAPVVPVGPKVRVYNPATGNLE
jgi:hypothetical protein